MIDIFKERQRSYQSGAPFGSFGAPLLTLVLWQEVKVRSVRFATDLGLCRLRLISFDSFALI